MIKDSRSYESQIIDAVRSVNRALGGTYGTSPAIGKTEFNQYEVQLIDAIKGIGRTLSGHGISVSGVVGGGEVSAAEFQALAIRVTKLEDESFFRLVDGNVTLKSDYSNLWVPGWLAAGGVGSGGGGGGGASNLKELDDVYHDALGVLRANGDPVTAGDALVYDSTLGWVASPAGGGGGSGTVTGIKVGTTSYSPDASGVVSLPAYPTESTVSGWGFTKNAGTVTSVTLTSGTGISVSDSGTAITSSGTRTIDISSTYQTYISNGNTAYGWGNHANAGYATQTWVQNQGYALNSDLASLASRVSSVEGWFSVVQVDGVDTLKLNPALAGLWANGWISAGGAGSGSGGGGATELNDLVDVNVPSSSRATGDVLSFDNATGKWTNVSKGTYLSGYATTSAVTTALADYALKTGDSTYNFLVNSLKFKNTGHADSYISADSGPGPVYYQHQRLKWTYSRTIGSISEPDVTESKYVAFLDDIPTSLKNPYALTFGSKTYDGSAAKTLTASDIGALTEHQSLANYVTLDGTQTITGAKTFSANVSVGADVIPSSDAVSKLGYSSRRFADLNVRTIGSLKEINFVNSNNDAKTGYVSFQSGYMLLRTGANVESSYKQINFHTTYGFYPEQTGVNLGYSGANTRWATIYGVNANLTGHLDIGPLRIEYDATNKALHITKADSSDNNTYGIYADGFVASGGVASGNDGQFVKYVNCATQTDYNNIGTYDNSTIYTIGTTTITKVYLGTTVLFSEN